MGVRIVIPTLKGEDIESRLSPHFGRAPFFSVVEIDKKGNVLSFQSVPNTGEHFGGVGHPPDRIVQLKPKYVIAYGMGKRAYNIFNQKQISVLKANSDTVKGVLEAYANHKLERLTEGCCHHKHK